MVKKAMIMAAGAGTRLDPLTQTVPKPMIPVVNMPVLELILTHLKKFGINDVVANTHYLAEAIHDRFDNNELGINFNFVHEDELSGTAGGVKKCEWFFEPGETFLVISGDALTDVNIDNLVKKHKASGALATMALKEIPLSEVSHFGVVVIDDKGRVKEFQEKPSIEEARSNLVNTGIYIFETDIFKYIPQGAFYDFAKNVFPALMANNEPLYAHIINEYWNDIGTISQYRQSSYDVLTSKVSIEPPYKKSPLGWCAKTSKISPTATFDGKVVIGENTIVENKVMFHGNCIIGKNCTISENAHIRNAIIWDNVVVEAGARLDGCIIASNAVIGKKSVITPSSIVPDSCIIYEHEELDKDTKLRSGDEYNSTLSLIE